MDDKKPYSVAQCQKIFDALVTLGESLATTTEALSLNDCSALLPKPASNSKSKKRGGLSKKAYATQQSYNQALCCLYDIITARVQLRITQRERSYEQIKALTSRFFDNLTACEEKLPKPYCMRLMAQAKSLSDDLRDHYLEWHHMAFEDSTADTDSDMRLCEAQEIADFVDDKVVSELSPQENSYKRLIIGKEAALTRCRAPALFFSLNLLVIYIDYTQRNASNLAEHLVNLDYEVEHYIRALESALSAFSKMSMCHQKLVRVLEEDAVASEDHELRASLRTLWQHETSIDRIVYEILSSYTTLHLNLLCHQMAIEKSGYRVVQSVGDPHHFQKVGQTRRIEAIVTTAETVWHTDERRMEAMRRALSTDVIFSDGNAGLHVQTSDGVDKQLKNIIDKRRTDREKKAENFSDYVARKSKMSSLFHEKIVNDFGSRGAELSSFKKHIEQAWVYADIVLPNPCIPLKDKQGLLKTVMIQTIAYQQMILDNWRIEHADDILSAFNFLSEATKNGAAYVVFGPDLLAESEKFFKTGLVSLDKGVPSGLVIYVLLQHTLLLNQTGTDGIYLEQTITLFKKEVDEQLSVYREKSECLETLRLALSACESIQDLESIQDSHNSPVEIQIENIRALAALFQHGQDLLKCSESKILSETLVKISEAMPFVDDAKALLTEIDSLPKIIKIALLKARLHLAALHYDETLTTAGDNTVTISLAETVNFDSQSDKNRQKMIYDCRKKLSQFPHDIGLEEARKAIATLHVTTVDELSHKVSCFPWSDCSEMSKYIEATSRYFCVFSPFSHHIDDSRLWLKVYGKLLETLSALCCKLSEQSTEYDTLYHPATDFMMDIYRHFIAESSNLTCNNEGMVNYVIEVSQRVARCIKSYIQYIERLGRSFNDNGQAARKAIASQEDSVLAAYFNKSDMTEVKSVNQLQDLYSRYLTDIMRPYFQLLQHYNNFHRKNSHYLQVMLETPEIGFNIENIDPTHVLPRAIIILQYFEAYVCSDFNIIETYYRSLRSWAYSDNVAAILKEQLNITEQARALESCVLDPKTVSSDALASVIARLQSLAFKSLVSYDLIRTNNISAMQAFARSSLKVIACMLQVAAQPYWRDDRQCMEVLSQSFSHMQSVEPCLHALSQAYDARTLKDNGFFQEWVRLQLNYLDALMQVILQDNVINPLQDHHFLLKYSDVLRQTLALVKYLPITERESLFGKFIERHQIFVKTVLSVQAKWQMPEAQSTLHRMQSDMKSSTSEPGDADMNRTGDINTLRINLLSSRIMALNCLYATFNWQTDKISGAHSLACEKRDILILLDSLRSSESSVNENIAALKTIVESPSGKVEVRKIKDLMKIIVSDAKLHDKTDDDVHTKLTREVQNLDATHIWEYSETVCQRILENAKALNERITNCTLVPEDEDYNAILNGVAEVDIKTKRGVGGEVNPDVNRFVRCYYGLTIMRVIVRQTSDSSGLDKFVGKNIEGKINFLLHEACAVLDDKFSYKEQESRDELVMLLSILSEDFLESHQKSYENLFAGPETDEEGNIQASPCSVAEADLKQCTKSVSPEQGSDLNPAEENELNDCHLFILSSAVDSFNIFMTETLRQRMKHACLKEKDDFMLQSLKYRAAGFIFEITSCLKKFTRAIDSNDHTVAILESGMADAILKADINPGKQQLQRYWQYGHDLHQAFLRALQIYLKMHCYLNHANRRLQKVASSLDAESPLHNHAREARGSELLSFVKNVYNLSSDEAKSLEDWLCNSLVITRRNEHPSIVKEVADTYAVITAVSDKARKNRRMREDDFPKFVRMRTMLCQRIVSNFDKALDALSRSKDMSAWQTHDKKFWQQAHNFLHDVAAATDVRQDLVSRLLCHTISYQSIFLQSYDRIPSEALQTTFSNVSEVIKKWPRKIRVTEDVLIHSRKIANTAMALLDKHHDNAFVSKVALDILIQDLRLILHVAREQQEPMTQYNVTEYTSGCDGKFYYLLDEYQKVQQKYVKAFIESLQHLGKLADAVTTARSLQEIEHCGQKYEEYVTEHLKQLCTIYAIHNQHQQIVFLYELRETTEGMPSPQKEEHVLLDSLDEVWAKPDILFITCLPSQAAYETNLSARLQGLKKQAQQNLVETKQTNSQCIEQAIQQALQALATSETSAEAALEKMSRLMDTLSPYQSELDASAECVRSYSAFAQSMKQAMADMEHPPFTLEDFSKRITHIPTQLPETIIAGIRKVYSHVKQDLFAQLTRRDVPTDNDLHACIIACAYGVPLYEEVKKSKHKKASASSAANDALTSLLSYLHSNLKKRFVAIIDETRRLEQLRLVDLSQEPVIDFMNQHGPALAALQKQRQALHELIEITDRLHEKMDAVLRSRQLPMISVKKWRVACCELIKPLGYPSAKGGDSLFYRFLSASDEVVLENILKRATDQHAKQQKQARKEQAARDRQAQRAEQARQKQEAERKKQAEKEKRAEQQRIEKAKKQAERRAREEERQQQAAERHAKKKAAKAKALADKKTAARTLAETVREEGRRLRGQHLCTPETSVTGTMTFKQTLASLAQYQDSELPPTSPEQVHGETSPSADAHGEKGYLKKASRHREPKIPPKHGKGLSAALTHRAALPVRQEHGPASMAAGYPHTAMPAAAYSAYGGPAPMPIPNGGTVPYRAIYVPVPVPVLDFNVIAFCDAAIKIAQRAPNGSFDRTLVESLLCAKNGAGPIHCLPVLQQLEAICAHHHFETDKAHAMLQLAHCKFYAAIITGQVSVQAGQLCQLYDEVSAQFSRAFDSVSGEVLEEISQKRQLLASYAQISQPPI